MRGEARRAAAFWSGPATTLVVLVAMEAFWRAVAPGVPYGGAVLAPVLLAVAFSTFVGGARSGVLSAAVLAVGAALSLPRPPDGVALLRASLVVACAFALVVLVGVLKRRLDAASERELARERTIAQSERSNAAESRRAAEILRANNETLETFVYVITHDLKEPVRAIDHHLANAQASYGAKDGELELARARDVDQRLSVLLQRLLEYSRASLSEPTARAIAVREVLEDPACRAVYEHAASTRGARVEIEPDERTSRVLADPTLLSQAMGNVVLNAIKHDPSPAPRVTLRTVRVGDLVEIRVQDGGPGFPARVLESMDRLKPGRPATVGGGFGLVIARRAIERMRGAMRLANLQGGAEVTIVLPAADARATARRVEVRDADAGATIEAPGA